ncbi:ABC transporter ATP-binding protein [Agromyces seonyuensis]|uniref:ATP-binding cassette domain-containing protein n=1 Tax=Agromyces seonyuensis TaxID=2662446 RepID=A0A6I4NWB3_9MICO|nr:ATP-binding cassette domain-containing protein [Agromyces seonyuensis]MWB98573.1 ATP-binding cassette domain-containing protein [Agromyces seonyuensis]
MPKGLPIEVRGLTKRFGDVTAVEQLSFTVQPGRVTGFLGPNGAGKTTTLRVLLGLVRPTAGTATIGGVPYAKLERPLEAVGASLDATFHPGRTARDHLKVYATAAGIAKPRIGEVLELTGIQSVADRRVGGYSLGMRQRLALAFTLLGDPGVLILDEPINGLDPEGIRWIRGFLQLLARDGRTVLVSSHLLSEVQQSVDDVVIISKGRLVRTGTLSSLELDSAPQSIVDSPDRDAAAAALTAAGLRFAPGRNGFIVDERDPAKVGAALAAAGVGVSLLHRLRSGLEDSFLQLVGESDGSANGGTPAPASEATVAHDGPAAETSAEAPPAVASEPPAESTEGKDA